WGCDTARFFVNLDEAVPMLKNGRAAVFQPVGRRVQDVTASFLDTPIAKDVAMRSDFVDVGDAMFERRLGPTWYPAESGYRWIPKTATVKMHGPVRDRQTIEANGYAPAAVLAAGPVEVTLRADGI